MKEYYLGIDMGSVSTNLVLMNSDKTIAHKVYLRSQGRPVDSLQEGMKKLQTDLTMSAVSIPVCPITPGINKETHFVPSFMLSGSNSKI